ncbi:4-amino-4-deoxy-L-arabinose transferase [Halopseudomonas xinjiangensis]|uniref:4-amino-4-deoxy-L-arabinose transferase n=1 Tax=Halopseudomonas xinjiangensis TaxID=487184 RepID=A0A1H1R3C9_9GAMM|nr:glycosyltransferase family 39 protein [Halopseudomonas xinjiangensis]SDS30238.1 4-amino-4-deoxy-L-arabinose transferase [Halopseudomonas xinjiangensis]
MRSSRATDLLWVAALALLMIGAGLGLRQPQNVDEERFLGVALEMMQNHSWLIPHRAGEIYPDKPPLFMWAVAFFTWLTGLPHVALYLPALLAGIITSLCLYDLGWRLWNRQTGVIAVLLYLASYQTYSIHRTGQIDGFLSLWIAIGLYGMVRHLLLGPAWRWYYVGCFAMGLGVISKGVGFLPILMLIPYAFAVRRGWMPVVPMPGNAARWLLGIGCMLLAVSIWLVPLLLSVYLAQAPESIAYVKEILFKQTAERYVNAWHHPEPFWFFFVEVIPKYWLPIFLALPWLIPAWYRELRRRDARLLLLLGWVVLVLLFFSLSTGKRKIYIYPALPALVLATAPLVPMLLQRWFGQRPRLRRIAIWIAGVWFALWCARGFVEPLVEGANPHEEVMHEAAERSAGAPLAIIHWREGHWLFARQPIVHFRFASGAGSDPLVGWLRQNPEGYGLVPASELDVCFDRDQAASLGETSRADWFLVSAAADSGRCEGRLADETYRFRWE